MPASQDHITTSTPMGAKLIPDGVTFRVWAPGALHVYVALDGVADYQPKPDDELVKDPATGHWTGFFPNVVDGARYRFLVVGPGGSGFKRDPWARELELHGYPDCDGIVRDRDSYPWHDGNFRPPAFNDLVVYQFHVGVFYAQDGQGRDNRAYRVAKFLDAIDRVEYLADLGVNALQPLPLVEFQGEWSLGYNGTDIFSPEMDYCVAPQDLAPYLEKVNALLAKKGCAPLTFDQLSGQVNQLKAFIDVCHLHGLAVLPDVVYNHAGGRFDRQSIDHFDFPADPGRHNNLYFSDQEWAGGTAFATCSPRQRAERRRVWIWTRSGAGWSVRGTCHAPGKRTTASRIMISSWMPTAITESHVSRSWRTGTTRGPGTRAVALALRLAYSSPPPGSR